MKGGAQKLDLNRVSKLWLGAFAVAIVLAGGSYRIGWYQRGQNDLAVAPQSLRLGGYNFTNPLLVCNINNSNVYTQDTLLGKDMQSIIDTNKSSGNISKASVYFIDLKKGQWTSVYPDAEFYPSSLGKIPLMIAYYRESESDPAILQKMLTYPAGSTDLNAMQDIVPENVIVPGQSYTVEQLIGYMIKYSDNNATELLDVNLDPDTLTHVYEDLGLPSEEKVDLANADFITAHEVSTMFRVLYNGTYLSRDNSEKALSLLSQVSFTQGLVAGVSSSTVVSHKLGLVGIAPNNITTEHELHDCGIVYGKDPYLMCVMTRGSAPLSTMEGIVAQLSKAAFSSVQNSR